MLCAGLTCRGFQSQHLIKSLNKEIGWLARRSFRRDRVQPINIEELANTRSTGPVALVHKIPLGRSTSNAL